MPDEGRAIDLAPLAGQIGGLQELAIEHDLLWFPLWLSPQHPSSLLSVVVYRKPGFGPL
jgi:hypothetical protein